jgi:hypothetical protein
MQLAWWHAPKHIKLRRTTPDATVPQARGNQQVHRGGDPQPQPAAAPARNSVQGRLGGGGIARPHGLAWHPHGTCMCVCRRRARPLCGPAIARSCTCASPSVAPHVCTHTGSAHTLATAWQSLRPPWPPLKISPWQSIRPPWQSGLPVLPPWQSLRTSCMHAHSHVAHKTPPLPRRDFGEVCVSLVGQWFR